MKIYFCLGAIEFQCNFVLMPSKVRKLVRTNQFQVKSTKISPYEPVSSQKYENGYRTDICNFTVMKKYQILLTACGMYVVKWESSIIDLLIWDKINHFSRVIKAKICNSNGIFVLLTVPLLACFPNSRLPNLYSQSYRWSCSGWTSSELECNCEGKEHNEDLGKLSFWLMLHLLAWPFRSLIAHS